MTLDELKNITMNEALQEFLKRNQLMDVCIFDMDQKSLKTAESFCINGKSLQINVR